MMDKYEIMFKVLVIFSFFNIEDASPCNQNLFGIGCRFQCHCKDNAQCNFITGHCPSGCDDYWAGPSCQYRNIAANNVFTEHSDSNTASRIAIDGNVSTCTHVDTGNSKPWWRIWLSNNYTITEIEIVIDKSYKDHFKRFKVTVEHIPEELATKPQNEYISPKVAVCYENNARISSTTINVVCDRPLKGNQVRIQPGEGATKLSLCEVRIFQGRNIAFGRRTSQSSESEKGGKALVAVDGITKREKLACSATTSENSTWWSVDLAHVIVINRINITTLDTDANDLRILISNDSLDWSIATLNTTGTAYLRDIAIDRMARFVKVTLHGDKQLRLCEVQILGDCLPNVCGFDCAEPCYCKTKNSKTKMSGKCPNGCLDNWTGENKSCNTAASCNVPGGVTLSVVALTFSILASMALATIASVFITIFALRLRRKSDSTNNECQVVSRSGTRSRSGPLSNLKFRVMSLYCNTTLTRQNNDSNSRNTEVVYDELDMPSRRR